jgi:hypothetical protein
MKELNHFRFPNKGGSKAKYDWDTILNGKTWSLNHGGDFSPEPKTFVAHVHGTAKRRGLKVHTHIDGKSVVVRAYKEKTVKSATPKLKTNLTPKLQIAVQPKLIPETADNSV